MISLYSVKPPPPTSVLCPFLILLRVILGLISVITDPGRHERCQWHWQDHAQTMYHTTEAEKFNLRRRRSSQF